MNEAKTFGLETLEKADQIKTLRELRQHLSSDLITSNDQVAEVIRKALISLSNRSEPAWGVTPESYDVCRAISSLRAELDSLNQ
jgi:hypothetical protein